jgi:hypothetical protein
LCFAAKNRISFRHLDGLDDQCSVRDIEMHVSSTVFVLLMQGGGGAINFGHVRLKFKVTYCN